MRSKIKMVPSYAPENEDIEKGYFWSLTNKGRHDLIKRHGGKYWKHTVRGGWCYLFYEKTDLTIRFRLNRKREIVDITTHTVAEGTRLAEMTDTAVQAVNYNPN